MFKKVNSFCCIPQFVLLNDALRSPKHELTQFSPKNAKYFFYLWGRGVKESIRKCDNLIVQDASGGIKCLPNVLRMIFSHYRNKDTGENINV